MRFQLNEPDVIQDVIEGEALIVHTRTGAYYSLHGCGIRIWEALLAGRSVPQICTLFDPSGDQGLEGLRAGVEQFVATLQEEQLVRPAPGPETDAPEPTPGLAYETPRLQKFTDMQELLLVDPIHEVVPEVGWPLRRDQG